MSNPQISVIVPMYNEEQNLHELHSRLAQVLTKLELPGEIIYVDDGSTDNTPEQLYFIVQQSQNVCVRVVQLPKRRGKTAALSAGFAVARGVYLITTDADLQEPPEVLPQFLNSLRCGEAHLVVGWRQQRQDTPLRIWASALFNAALHWLTDLDLHDVNCGTKVMKRDVAEQLVRWMVSDMHRYLPVLAARMGYCVSELPVPHTPRRRGRSRFGASRYLLALIDWFPVTLLWPRGQVAWLSLVVASAALLAVDQPIGGLGAALSVLWLLAALRLWWLRRGV